MVVMNESIVLPELTFQAFDLYTTIKLVKFCSSNLTTGKEEQVLFVDLNTYMKMGITDLQLLFL